MIRRFFKLVLACLVLAGTSVQYARAQESPPAPKTIIILDASGSMWGQIDGSAKIDIAKEVIEDLLKSLDPKLELGLMAYGHRREGDCSDIELMIPPGQVDRAKFLEVVLSISPKGKTPLTDSVEQAANYLKYETVPGSVILVSDGIENCDRDPCALAKILKGNGIDFKAHVVAFDLTEDDAKTIRCLADETGGQFLPAQDAGSLKDALEIAVREVVEKATERGKPLPTGEGTPKPEPEEILTPATLKGPAKVVAGSRFNVEWTGPDNRGDRIGIVTDGAEDSANGNFRYTLLGSPLELVAPVEPGFCELRYRSRSGKILGRADIEVVEALATVKAPAEIPAGKKIAVAWTGPANRGDSIAFAPVGAPANEYASSRYASSSKKTTEVHAPVEPGDYEVRYITARNPKVLASQPVKIVPAQATVSAPEIVMGGAPIPIEWTGPAAQGDMLGIAARGAKSLHRGLYAYPRKGASIDAPVEPGSYEVRYMGRGSKVLATFDITVTPPIATIRATGSAMAGAVIEVNWTGPSGTGDYLIVVPEGAPESENKNYNYTRYGSPITLIVTDNVGRGEIRYVSGKSKKVLKRQPITITEPVATLDAPASAPGGKTFEVKWTGPGSKRDMIAIAEKESAANAYLAYKKLQQGVPTKIRTPKKPGDYELRYISGAGKILAKQPFAITE